MALYRCSNCDLLTTVPDGENALEYFCAGCESVGSLLLQAENVVMMRGLPPTHKKNKEPKKPRKLSEFKETDVPRVNMDALGYGAALPEGITVLLSGDAGAGKSTFLVQSLSSVIEKGGSVLYFASEEASVRVAMRARRVGAHPDMQLLYCDSLYKITNWIAKLRPTIAVVDSLNNIVSVEAEGENKSLIDRLVLLRKECERVGTTAVCICHENKEGEIYGPQRLEHECDIYMHIKKDLSTPEEVRTIVGVKNRNFRSGAYAAFQLKEDGCVYCPIPGSDEAKAAESKAEGNAEDGAC